MAKTEQFHMSRAQRQLRHFSDGFKKEKVREIESGLSKVSDICKEYEVTAAAVYKWLGKYGVSKNKPERIIVEKKSDTAKLQALRERVAELERIIGQKQLLVDFQKTMIEQAEEHYRVEIKKKISGKPSDTIGKTEKK